MGDGQVSWAVVEWLSMWRQTLACDFQIDAKEGALKMRLGIIAVSIGAAALTGSLAHAQNVTPAEVEAAFRQASPIMQSDQSGFVSRYTTEREVWSSARPSPKGDVMPSGIISLAKPATRFVDITVSRPAWTGGTPAGDDVSAALAARGR
jgi:hypothetical protein